MAEQSGSGSQVQLENTTEHVLHITVAGGNVVSVPPSVDGSGGTTVTFNDADERSRFEAALQTESVQTWIKDKHLVVHGKGGAFSAQPSTDPNAQGAQGAGSQQAGGPGAQQPGAHDPANAPTSPATKRGGRSGQE